jgi:hypothetical protein
VNGKNQKLRDASGKDLPEHNWVWSPQGVINMHYPERWGYLQFTRQPGTTWQLPLAERRKQQLWRVYYRQQQHKEKTGRYASTLAELQLPAQVEVDQQANELQLAATPYQFTATLTAAGQPTFRLNDEGLLEPVKP